MPCWRRSTSGRRGIKAAPLVDADERAPLGPSQLFLSAFHISPPAAGGRRAEESHDGLRLSGGSGVEAAGGSKLIGRTGRRGSSSGIGWW
jgi:hypothetical protein